MNKDELAKLLKINEKREEAKRIEAQMTEANFWADRERATQISQRLAELNDLVKKFEQAETAEQIKELEKEAVFSGEHDDKGAVLSVHAGAGGTEAQDWAGMLLRMYLRFCERKGFKTELIDKTDGEEAGVKSAAIKVGGTNVYGNLRGEAGVHRLVRISPFDSDKARHTSFALVEVIPEFDELGDIEINDKDLKIDVYRSSGKGGQSVNTTDSAVRITHLPSKIVVAVQNERSQLQNRETAMKILKMKLKKIQLDTQKKKESDIRGGHVSAEWGNQIRSYVLMPYQQVKDLRTGFESSNPNAVLDGELDGFIDAFLRKSPK